jgi:UDP-2,4-diacetamido-2,4,6-trideoxy-beta-L-altropyranose hydrolase
VLNGSPHLVVRADAGPEIGAGHVMRSLALAQAWQDAGGEATFVSASMPKGLRKRLANEGVRIVELDSVRGTVEDAEATAREVDLQEAIAVVDGYIFGQDYQRVVVRKAKRMLVLDDHARIGSYCADIILDQNLGVDAESYSHRPSGSRVLTGSEYTLLRREFRLFAPPERRAPESVLKILVTMGGADADNATLMVMQAIEGIGAGDVEVTVVVGGSNPNATILNAEAVRMRTRFVLERDLVDMAGMMAWADVAVSGGGSTCWELAYMGLPAWVVALAENQVPIAEALDRAGVVRFIGELGKVNQHALEAALREFVNGREKVEEMGLRSRGLVDGKGAERVVAALRE